MARKVITREWLIENGVAPPVIDAAIAEADRRASGPVAEPTRRKPPAHFRGVMNQTEARFARLLDAGRWIAPVARWAFEPEVLELAPDMTYCPDFRLDLEDGGIDCVDTKGAHCWEDSVVKCKSASVIIPSRRFFIVTLSGREWRIRQVGVRERKTIKVLVMEHAQ